MANKAYLRQQLGLYLKHFRINSYDHSLRTQSDLGAALGITQKQVSLIECGLSEPSVQLAAEWSKKTGWFEGCDLVTYLYGLDPLELVPVDPQLNQSVSEALHNLRRQLRQALEAVEQFVDDEPEVALAIRRGGYTVDPLTKFNEKQIADLIPAVRTFFYAAERQNRTDLQEICSMWNVEALAEQVAMPKIDQLDKVLVAR
ncbi:helix-turn-helix domain-containing protein [Brevibacillus massiliensis]|jgi:transcriptional regulator with XRE-family HTH domain|uniref:helix-turn-helix domain-containing protein n=1 Tax=Brevibacillus massiliensis TaxID=1118054 RepID=UPI00036EC0F8|nr:helix-turn-helix transcriptional regulator [Brevibacillus massiliensis]